ncbi:hypothetical protein MH1LPH_11660 [Lactiplantibacillus brownii]
MTNLTGQLRRQASRLCYNRFHLVQTERGKFNGTNSEPLSWRLFADSGLKGY